jgi:hypothetical protein
VSDPVPLLSADVVLQDSHHVVIKVPGKGLELLDTLTGALTVASPSTRYWCASLAPFPVVAIAHDPGSNERIGDPTVVACSATGHHESGLPTDAWSYAGVSGGGLFIWPAAHGLEAAHLVG